MDLFEHFKKLSGTYPNSAIAQALAIRVDIEEGRLTIADFSQFVGSSDVQSRLASEANQVPNHVERVGRVDSSRVQFTLEATLSILEESVDNLDLNEVRRLLAIAEYSETRAVNWRTELARQYASAVEIDDGFSWG
jgi:hypothetical protein